MAQAVDIAIVGAGAAGLMAAIWAGRSGGGRIIVLDSGKHLGAKILVAGGGRCNVTHDVVVPEAFAGSTHNAIRKVLRRFDVPQTTEFFRELGVELKREETGKLFPTTDKARTVLNALLGAARAAGVTIKNPWWVKSITKQDDGFEVIGADETIRARRVVLATGGKSLPKSGSDGHGYSIAKSLGHSITPRVFASLVPLTLPSTHFLCGLSGVSAVVTLQVCAGNCKRLRVFTESMLCTHFGLSGPAVLDISRYFIDARADDPDAQLIINWLPNLSLESADAALIELSQRRISPARWLREQGLPDRLAKALCEHSGIDSSAPLRNLARKTRRGFAQTLTELPVPVTGDRGFNHAEVTAGGVPLREIKLETMESRICPNLHICGEICDVDGRIGGYNFQWAWASGYIAGTAAAKSCAPGVTSAMRTTGE